MCDKNKNSETEKPKCQDCGTQSDSVKKRPDGKAGYQCYHCYKNFLSWEQGIRIMYGNE